MKTSMKYMICLCLALFIAGMVSAQTSKSKTPAKTQTPAKKTTPPVVKKDITLSLKSLCERNLQVFAGPKENLKDPTLKTVGGLSKNTLYVKTYDVVCIIVNGKPISCANVKPEHTAVEINSSGNVISIK